MSSLFLLNKWCIDSNEYYLSRLAEKECPSSDLSAENMGTMSYRMRTVHAYESYALIQ